MTPHPFQTIALDLEGTLISNAVSIFPRPGLYDFLEFCRNSFPNVVLFTTVKEERVRQVIKILVDEDVVPAWFQDIPYIHWTGKIKDLGFIQNASPEEILLVDDMEIYIHPEQTKQWIPISCFESPYPKTDRELVSLTKHLKSRLGL